MKQMGKLNSKVGGVGQTVGIKDLEFRLLRTEWSTTRAVNFEIYFDRGIDRYGLKWLNTMKTYKLVSQVEAGTIRFDESTEGS